MACHHDCARLESISPVWEQALHLHSMVRMRGVTHRLFLQHTLEQGRLNSRIGITVGCIQAAVIIPIVLEHANNSITSFNQQAELCCKNAITWRKNGIWIGTRSNWREDDLREPSAEVAHNIIGITYPLDESCKQRSTFNDQDSSDYSWKSQ